MVALPQRPSAGKLPRVAQNMGPKGGVAGWGEDHWPEDLQVGVEGPSWSEVTVATRGQPLPMQLAAGGGILGRGGFGAGRQQKTQPFLPASSLQRLSLLVRSPD